MAVTKVRSKWVGGNLVFSTLAGVEIARFNGTTGKLVAGTVALGAEVVNVVKAALAPGNANAFSFAIANPEGAKCLIHKVLLDVTTAGGTGSSVMDVGVAANGTTASDNLIDGADLNADALYDNVTDNGANGKSRQRWGATEFVTGRILVAHAAALAGNVYVLYTKA